MVATFNPPIREAEIKSALIEHFFAEGWIDDDAVIVNEMPVPTWARRADLVLANGKLIAVEIKSDGDKVTRLRDQVKAYEEFFECVIVVTGPRHLSAVLAQTEERVGVIVARPDGSVAGLQLEIIREPRTRRLDSDASIRLMLANDLAKAARKAGAKISSRADRDTLEKVARQLPAELLREEAISAVKRKYASYHRAFISSRNQGSTALAFSELKKPSWNVSVSRSKPIVTTSAAKVDVQLKVTPRQIRSADKGLIHRLLQNLLRLAHLRS